jgi:hypothetical protein
VGGFRVVSCTAGSLLGMSAGALELVVSSGSTVGGSSGDVAGGLPDDLDELSDPECDTGV